jgi:uncharacterized protein (DUF934 family)
MPKLTKIGERVEDNWQVLPKDAVLDTAQLADGNWLVPIKLYNANSAALAQQTNLGVWLDSDDEAAEVAEISGRLPVIGVNFPVFTDGRGFSIGRTIRERYKFPGELRAIGNFMQDQLCYLKRCGFDAFVVSDEANVASMAQSLRDFSDFYQAAVDQPTPLFRRRFGAL